MKEQKKLGIIIIGILLIVLLVVGLFLILRNPNRLNSKEKKWIKDNKSVLIDVRIPNDINTFGYGGEGVFFDFLNNFKEKYNLEINVIPYSIGSITPGVSFKVDNVTTPDDILFFEDHYVVIGKEEVIINNTNDFNNKKIGLLNTDLSYVSYYFNEPGITYEQFNNFESLMGALVNLDYVVVPLNRSLKTVLNSKYHIVYHLSDIKQYYYLGVENNNTLLSILKKHYNVWHKIEFEQSYNNNLMITFKNGLNLEEADLYSLSSKEYRFGTVNNAPYEILSGSNYGGIIGKYLNGFIKMTGIDVKYLKFKSYENLNKVANNNKLDLYFGYAKLANKFININSGLKLEYEIIGKNTNKTVINSLNSLQGKTIYVLDDSILKEYFQSLKIATIKTYSKTDDLFKLAKKDNLIVVDSLIFDYYNNTRLKNVVSKYKGEINGSKLQFQSNLDPTFNQIFKSYVESIDSSIMKNLGIDDYNRVLNTSSIFAQIVKYIFYGLLVIAFIFLLIFNHTRRVKISTKIKKDSKMKYYDYLTNLKNRNYLNENIEKWNQNNIYPQVIIILDLNNIKDINDTYGHQEGDKQIISAANILIKTQLENSEIIRTDGNEFLVYLVDHNEKQVSSYIHKLYKEFKTLPYEYGVSLGFSVIDNDLKLIDDAINEATLDMRTNKINGVKDVEKDKILF